MIVISGALVLVALVLLVLGLTMTDLDFVYGSIGISLVSFVFLVIGILQRRGEPAPSAAPVSDDSTADSGTPKDDAPAVGASGRPAPQFVPAATTADDAPASRGSGRTAVAEEIDDAELLPGGGPVLVVEGRPRYHVEGCRYLSGRTVEELDVLDAREDGFTACGVCKPDEVLEELYGPLDEVEEPAEPELPAAEPVEAEPEPADEPAPAKARRGRVAGSSKVDLDKTAVLEAPRTTKAKAPSKAAKAPAKAAKAAKAPAKETAGKASRSTAKVAAVPAPVPAPLPAAAVPTEPAAAASTRGKVFVIPDRDRFHLASCRFVREADGTEQLTRTQAGKQGFRACGVCKP